MYIGACVCMMLCVMRACARVSACEWITWFRPPSKHVSVSPAQNKTSLCPKIWDSVVNIKDGHSFRSRLLVGNGYLKSFPPGTIKATVSFLQDEESGFPESWHIYFLGSITSIILGSLNTTDIMLDSQKCRRGRQLASHTTTIHRSETFPHVSDV